MAATVKASQDGLNRVDKARQKKGWAKTTKKWADLAYTSPATLKRFWAGIAIRTESFKDICLAVGIDDWESLIDETSNHNPESSRVEERLSFAIVGSIDEHDKRKLDAIVALLQQMTGDITIKILDIDEGSIKLVLGGSKKALERIEALFNSGELKHIQGIEVLDAHILNSEELVQLIRKNGAEGLDLSGADLSRANLHRANLHRANLRSANLNGADLSGADLSYVSLSDANLNSAYLIGANLNSANLIGANLSGANLSGADLSYVSLSGANLSDANLNGANLNGANLNGADLNSANLSGADLNSAYLNSANLSDASLSGADLSYANLNGADLIGADLSGADLSYANLNGADLSGADLSGAIVKDARFISVVGIAEYEQRELEARGAIFQDPPRSRDRAFVFR